MSKRHDELVKSIEKCIQAIKESNSRITYDEGTKSYIISDSPAAPWYFFTSMLSNMANLHIYQHELKELEKKTELEFLRNLKNVLSKN